ncbi:unnamed protein product [Owenia fusiformis]|uniref:Uncharacterized protein n=1 Tax=Owenia fusiformis TaxID=6347 RepID=A0A8S4NIU3_OWEFU|nr:unnamed protein product [Owenia fusiformis]
MYRCESNDNGTDWEYKWQKGEEWVQTKAFALPHPSTPKCHNSYFIQRTWNAHENVHDICSKRIYVGVNDIESCMSIACEEKADVLDYVTDDRTCTISHCSWKFKTWEYNFYFAKTLEVSDKVATYTLSPPIYPPMSTESKTSTTTLNNTIRESTKYIIATTKDPLNEHETTKGTFAALTEQMESIRSKNFDFKTLAMVMAGTTALFFILSALTVIYIICQRFSRRQTPSRNNRPASSACTYNCIDEEVSTVPLQISR